MEINYLGHSTFYLKNKEVKLICDPAGEAAGFKQAKLSADIVTISHNQHEDHDDLSMITGDPMIISGPGEYEIKGVSIVGLATWHDEAEGKDRGKNTIYIIDMDDLRIAHLGDLGHKLSEKQAETLDGVDVLIVPVGGVYSLNPETAWKVVRQINPSVVIPMHYKTSEHGPVFAKLSGVEDFVKVSGLEPKKETKLFLKASELPEELELVVLDRYGR
jgi:L-ascorbate metabolism protein UlaG (beta-lactamase superfamily)